MSSGQRGDARFPFAYEVPTPEGAEGWEEMYPYYYRFDKEPGPRRDWESQFFWFQDSMHHGEPLYPLDAIHSMAWQWALSSYNSRTFVVPPALGIAHRVLNGYLYITPIPVTDPKEVERRAQYFMRRAGYYYQNWNRIFEEWKINAEKIIKEMESVEFNELPEFEDDEVVFKHLGYSKSSSQLYENFHKLVLLHFKLWQKHFEMLNLGCATYLTFYLFCKEKFQPEIERRKKTNRCGEKEQTAAGPGKPPEVITKPFTIMLWGITKERIERWFSGAAGESAKQPTGMPASPGIAEGPARVVLSAEEIVKEGEILVAPITAPSWNPVFVFLKVKATVTDI